MAGALGFKILGQRRHDGSRRQAAQGVARGPLAQDAHGLQASKVRLALDEGPQDRILELVKAGAPLFPEGRKTAGHVHGAGLVEGGDILAHGPQLPARADQQIQNHPLPGTARLLAVELPPDLVVKSRRGYAAGVAVQGVGGGHGIAHGIYGFRQPGMLFKLRRVQLRVQQTRNVKAARHNENALMLLSRLPDPAGHVGLSCQTPVLQKLHLRSLPAGQDAIGMHQADKGFAAQGQPFHLEIFLPKFLKGTQSRLFAQPLLKTVVGEISVRSVAELFRIGPQTAGLPGGQQNFSKAQVDEPSGDAESPGGAQCHQLRRGIEKGIPATPKSRLVTVGEILSLVPAGVVEGHGGLRLRVRQDVHQIIGILRALHQNAVGSVTFDQLFQMPRADGAVVADGIVEHGRVRIKGDHFRRLLAS